METTKTKLTPQFKPSFYGKEYVIDIKGIKPDTIKFGLFLHTIFTKLEKMRTVNDFSEHANGSSIIICIQPRASIKKVLHELLN